MGTALARPSVSSSASAGIGLGPGVVGLLPGGEGGVGCGFLLREEGLGFRGNVKVLVGGKSETGAGGIDEFRAAFAVALGGAGDFRDALADERSWR